MKRARVALCTVVALMSVSSVASADDLRVQLGAGGQRMHAPSYDALDVSNAFAYSSVELGYTAPALSKYVEGGLMFQAGGSSEVGLRGSFSDQLQLEWSLQRVMLGADVGVQLGRYFRPSVKLGVGYAHQRLDMLGANGERYHDHAHDVVGFGALGGRVMAPLSLGGFSGERKEPRFTLGIQGHWGYMAQTSASFDELRLSDPKEDDPWRRDPIALGELSTRGRIFMGGVFLQIRI